jgi:hypothetical protein
MNIIDKSDSDKENNEVIDENVNSKCSKKKDKRIYFTLHPDGKGGM